MAVNLLHYRSWRGEFHPPWMGAWPVARTALMMIFRRKLFWVLYALALTMFLLFFFGQYLLSWAQTQAGETSVKVGVVRTEPGRLIGILRDTLELNGSGQTYRNFFSFQGYMVMIVLALAGAILVGNDFQFGSLPFYLSKPLAPWQYLLGKFLAVAVFVNLMTTLPALVLFCQYGLLESWDYFFQNGWVLAAWEAGDSTLELRLPNPLLFGIIGYGLVLTACLSLLLLAAASWLRRTVPLIMAWTTLFFFLRLVAAGLVDRLHYPARWRLIDLWNDAYVTGSACLGLASEGGHPKVSEAMLVLGGTCILCLSYLSHRIRAVEVVH